MGRGLPGAAVLVLCPLLASCEAASSASSATALLRVESAQLVRGAPPEDAAGPAVSGVTVFETRIWPGQVAKPLSGTLQAGATAAAVYLAGDRVHYIVPAAAPDVTAPTQPTFSAQLAFAAWLDAGPQLLSVQAVDEAGRYGPARRVRLDAVADARQERPAAPLLFVLRWDRGADLDLHVEEPGGDVIWSRRKVGAASGGVGVGVGVLDLDSNQACVLDGRQREQVVYERPPPAGRYRVRVDTFSLCKEATAYWFVEAYREGGAPPIATVRGQSLPSDTRGPHGAGSGVLALELSLP